MNNYLEKIKNGSDVRQTLIALRSEIRDEQQRKALAYEMAGDFSVFTGLLEDDDPKVRKNAALILGGMESDDLTEILWNAYLKEQTMYVRADFLKALAGSDCSAYLPALRERLELLYAETPSTAEEKHVREECVALKQLLMRYEQPKKHKFTGYEKELEIILMTNRMHREVTREQLGDDIPVKYLAGGMRFCTQELKKILEIRTYSELLFPLRRCPLLSGSPERMAEQIIKSGMMAFLCELHEGRPPFYFRLELKSPMPAAQKTDLVKKLSAALERQSERRLVNATSGYELELRLVANKSGQFVPLVRLFTIPERRFAYRKNALATSIAPVNAALAVHLAKDYLTEGAQVLDPFCGVGTMLIERSRYGKTGSLYGLDILQDAVQKARENAEAARVPVNYINRDFFDFTHAYLFDEIITNLPVMGKSRDAGQLALLYERFLERAQTVLKPGAVIVAYTPEARLLRASLVNYRQYVFLKEYCVNERDNTCVEIFRFRGN